MKNTRGRAAAPSRLRRASRSRRAKPAGALKRTFPLRAPCARRRTPPLEGGLQLRHLRVQRAHARSKRDERGHGRLSGAEPIAGHLRPVRTRLRSCATAGWFQVLPSIEGMRTIPRLLRFRLDGAPARPSPKIRIEGPWSASRISWPFHSGPAPDALAGPEVERRPGRLSSKAVHVSVVQDEVLNRGPELAVDHSSAAFHFPPSSFQFEAARGPAAANQHGCRRRG